MGLLATHGKTADEWNTFVAGSSGVINAVNDKIQDKNFQYYNFERTSFIDCEFTNCDFSQSVFSNTKSLNASNKGTTFEKCNFSDLIAEGNSLNFNGATLKSCIFEKCKFYQINFSNTSIIKCIFQNANLTKCYFDNSSFTKSNLNRAHFQSCRFQHTTWKNVIIGPNTFFKYCIFTPQSSNKPHDVLNDKSETTTFTNPFKKWNWKLVSKIGRVPALELAWTLFGIGLFIISSIIFINESKFIRDGIEYPIPIPFNLELLTVGALFASIGTFLYRACCPDRIQNFTENEWVEGHGHPRLFYREACVKNIKGLIATTIFLTIGIAILGYLIIARAWYVLSHLLFY